MTKDPNTASYLTKHERRRRDDTSHDSNARMDGTRGIASRHERSEAKRMKRQAALFEEHHGGISAKKRTIEELEKKNRYAVKAARKAEKARVKAARKAEEVGAITATPIHKSAEGVVDGGQEQGLEKAHSLPSSAVYREDPSLTSLPQSSVDLFLSENFINIHDPWPSSTLRPIMKFSQLPEAANFSDSLFAFKNPTPIQAAAWPFLLSGRDVVGVAETGSGKTLAFGIPCVCSLSRFPKSEPPAKAVIVSPTRELAVQIHAQIEKLAKPTSLSTVSVYGGVPKDQQREALRTAHIVVGTPGRLIDLINEGAADLRSVKYLVLDEADRMLDKGFEEEIRKIISTTPTEGRQTLMFTATWPPSVRDLASTFMTQPLHISIGADNPTGELRANTKIRQIIEVVDSQSKDQRLLQILKQHSSAQNDRILVFCLYKKEAARVERFLRQRSLNVTGIHGDMAQPARQRSIDSLRNGSCPLLVATDVAARGLDIPSVKLVVNVTFPLTVEDYVHRIGRTGRAGAEGLAITLFTEHDKAQSGALINVLRAAGQEVPEEPLRFGTTVKRKEHEAYGGFYKNMGVGDKKKGTKIRFGD